MNKVHIYNTIEHKFKGIRSMAGFLVPVDWEIQIKLASTPISKSVNEIEKETIIRDITVSYQKLKWWLQNYMDEVLVVSDKDIAAIELFVQGEFKNTLLTLPHEATDSCLCESLCKKITVLAGKNLQIIEVNLKSSDLESTFFFSEEGGYSIPMDNSSYSGHSLYENPWWCREDCDTFEPIKIEGVEYEDLLHNAETSSELKMVSEAIYESTFGHNADDTDSDVDEEKDTIILNMSEEWHPKKV